MLKMVLILPLLLECTPIQLWHSLIMSTCTSSLAQSVFILSLILVVSLPLLPLWTLTIVVSRGDNPQ